MSFEPIPEQSGQAPIGVLNENNLEEISLKANPQTYIVDTKTAATLQRMKLKSIWL